MCGISADSIESHARFATKLNLPYPLLSDEEHVFLEKIGVWQQKKMLGVPYMGIMRSTFAIDPQGIVRLAWEKVSVDGHADAVLAAVKGAM